MGSSKLFYETCADDFVPSDTTVVKGAMDTFAPAAPPQTPLAEYRLLSPSAAVRVSPLALGAMSLGDQWTGHMGRAMDKDASFALLDAFYKAGGNFIDTANNYQDEMSEHIIGEWMETRGVRDQIVLAAKYTQTYRRRQGQNAPGIIVNFAGNHKKSMKHSLEHSLRKLRTDYVDLFYVHWWDHSTSIPELMQGLNDLVRSGKVLYLGISDTPAWVVAGANEYARAHGMAQFVVYQGLWSLADRDIERDIIPMCRAYGMGLCAWGTLGSGRFKRPEELEALKGSKVRSREVAVTPAQLAVATALTKVADEIGSTPTAVAMAFVRTKMAYVFPIVGGSQAHLESNIAALDVKLTPEQVEQLDKACKFNPGFPTAVFGTDPHYTGGVPDGPHVGLGGKVTYVAFP